MTNEQSYQFRVVTKNPDIHIGMPPHNIILSEKGFHYNGVLIEDAGEAHRAFVAVINGIQYSAPLIYPCTDGAADARDADGKPRIAAWRKDAARMDWLDCQGFAYGFEDMHEGNRWEIDGPFPTVRAAIDAAIAASMAQTREE